MDHREMVEENVRQLTIVGNAFGLMRSLKAGYFLDLDEEKAITAALYLLAQGVNKWNKFHVELEATGLPDDPRK